MTYRRRIALFAGWIPALLLAAHRPVGAMDLTLVDSLPADNTTVELRHIAANAGQTAPPADLSKCYGFAQVEGYSVALTDISHYGANRYFTYEFLVWRSGEQTTTQVLFAVTSNSSFRDFFRDVPFTLADGARKASGTISSIPFHPLDPIPLCRPGSGSPDKPLPSTSSPLRVYLTGSTQYTVFLECSDAANTPELIALSDATPGNPGYWQSVSYNSSYYGPHGPSQPVTTRKFELLSATLIPKLTTAAAARLRRLSVKDSPDDAIAFVLTYAIQPKGLPIQMRIEIPITFYPSGYVIAGALSLGTGAGWLATLLLMFAAGRPKSWKVLGRALVLGLLLSLIAFFLAFLAYSTGCGLQLFGLDVNPLDELVLFAMGLICGCAALLKVDELLKAIDGAFSKMNLSSASTALSFFLLAFLLCPSARAEAHRLPLAGLSACPDGDVIGLDRDGTVIQFSSASPGAWRRAGRVERSMTPAELVCATVDGKKTAFVVGMALGNIWVVRMDLSSGVWMQKMVAGGTSAGIAFDPNSQLLFLSSANVRAIYSMNAGLANPSQWAPVFNSAESIGSLAVDPAGQRLLVGEAFSGVIYALPLGAGRQSTLVQGMGTVNSLSVDSSRNLLYVADAGRHTVWSVPLAGDGPRKLRAFYHSDELKAVSGVAADAQSNVWVALFSKPDVVVLGPDGKQLSTIP